LCDSYFVVTTGLVTPGEWSGRAGKAALDKRNAAAQQRMATKRWALLRCPTCVELVSGISFLDWMERCLRDTDMLTPLSPCWAVCFEEEQPPPLYVDQRPASEVGAKPQWTLASGVGPAGLELDSSRSCRLWKPSLRPAGIDAPRYTDDADLGGAHHSLVRANVEAALAELDAARADALAERVHAARPLFRADRWGLVAEQVEELAGRAECAHAEAERTERQGWSQKRRRQEARGALSRLTVGESGGAQGLSAARRRRGTPVAWPVT
jgi:hypothetical protein